MRKRVVFNMDMPNEESSPGKKNLNIISLMIISLVVIYVLLLLKTAWLGDDAYITFRTIDNFYKWIWFTLECH